MTEYTAFVAFLPFLPAQTFVLKMITRNFDDTTSFTTSQPCAAGSIMDVCMVQVRLACATAT